MSLRRSVPFSVALIATSLALLAATGCSEEAEICSLSGVDPQLGRAVAGETVYLPAPGLGSDACASQAWLVAEAPDGFAGAPLAEAAGRYVRFTPTVPGTYVLALGDTGLATRLTAVAADGAPFEMFPYFASPRSLTLVAGNIWATNVQSPTISVVDPASGDLLDTVGVGAWPVAIAWRPGLEVAVVAQRAGDTLGVVDVASRALVDAIWVGDEPTNVVLSPDGATAYVALSTEAAVAVVDVAARRLVGRFAVNRDPLGMALSDDGSLLYVASYRSGQAERFPFDDVPSADAEDIAVVDVATGEVVDWIAAVGSTINDVLVRGDDLFVSTTRTRPEELGIDLDNRTFSHVVARYDRASGAEEAVADLTRQDGSGGPVVTVHGLALDGDTLWAVAEGSDVAVALDPETLAERERFDAPGRPRALVAADGAAYVHGAVAFTVTAAGARTWSTELPGDPRPRDVAEGQAFVVGAGDAYGANHACASCHVDGLLDGNSWQTGPFPVFFAVRPFYWLGRSGPLGWEGYLSDVRNFANSVPGPTTGRNHSTAEAEALNAYLTSLVPPPPANGHTERDGSMTTLAAEGALVFERAGCATCHAGPLTSDGLRYEEGLTPGESVTPSLVGAYRYNWWLKTGEARTLAEVVDVALEVEPPDEPVSADERAALVAYLEQLVPREVFVVGSTPVNGAEGVDPGRAIRVELSHALDAPTVTPASVRLLDAAGSEVSAERRVEGRVIWLTPAAALDADAGYTVVIDGSVASFRLGPMGVEERLRFRTAAAPALRLEGAYRWTVAHPVLDFAAGGLSETASFDATLDMELAPTAAGATAAMTLSPTLDFTAELVLDGDTLRLPGLSLPVSQSETGVVQMSHTWPTTGDVEDLDGDGVVDRASGTMRVSGPGYAASEVAWELAPVPEDDGSCGETSGTHALTLDIDGEGDLTVAWEDDVEALGLYVADQEAAPPLGPGPMRGGTAYWVLQATAFPAGFASAVTYGEVPAGAQDATEASGGPAGGAPLDGVGCVRVSVVFTDFTTSRAEVVF